MSSNPTSGDAAFDLERFVRAQNQDAGANRTVYDCVLEELANGRKRSHWIWYIFPQLAGLGRSTMAQRFGIGSRDEAVAYALHPILGPRLMHCTQQVIAIQDRDINAIFGSPDDLKFRSCMTLFAAVWGEPVFRAALEKYYYGDEDALTLGMLG
jgi:uncharacterized protein (DUF1810 family)